MVTAMMAENAIAQEIDKGDFKNYYEKEKAMMAENATAQKIDKGDFKDYYEKYLAPSSIFAMEYIPIGNIRTDPVVTQVCLSDHVHTFYGENGEYLNVLA